MTRASLAAVAVLIACSTRAPSRRAPRPVSAAPDRSIRVALTLASGRSTVSATSEFQWLVADGRTFLARGRAGEQWRAERTGTGADARVRVMRPDGVPTAWQARLYARASEDGLLVVNGKRYRGQIEMLPGDTGVAIVNRLGVEEYLRGVVPLEMGRLGTRDSAALQAQAVASRSYAYIRLGCRQCVMGDVRASTADQVYGGVDAESEEANAAIDATRGMVLRFQGRTVDAPFHSTCGGTTAEPSEVWRSGTSPYLERVSDRIGNSERYYCDIAPRYRWTRTLTGAVLNEALEAYLATYVSVPGGKPGTAKAIGVRSRTASGRVAIADVETERGIFALRGNDMRYVLRQPGGEILPSTYFSVEPEYRDGRVARVTFRGRGNGHGVGMCQWGAIGRARAGQSFRTILGTYYPGTSIGIQ